MALKFFITERREREGEREKERWREGEKEREIERKKETVIDYIPTI